MYADFNTTGNSNNDVSIIFLTEAPPLSRYIKPVALPSLLDVNDSFVGRPALISGWGMTVVNSTTQETLQWTTVYVISNIKCKKYFKPGIIVESMLCAHDVDTSACFGDSGSALVVNTGGSYKQIGIVSFGPECCDPRIPTAYTRVTSFLEWITTTCEMAK
ncbi:chymotrypsinogen A-like [Schistocerca gregaria]|uniref:chymotrypsinogen A-like n=1 Tax=Schistocerca gregaria TaxID=7010 RepID=UPI00211EAD33|nr:chymotrypsinogen A-like [Schistocerca gregaria]